MKSVFSSPKSYLFPVLLGIAVSLIVVGSVSFYLEIKALHEQVDIGLAALLAERPGIAIPRDSVPPTISIVSPIDASFVNDASFATVEADVYDASGVDQVMVLIDGQKLASDSNPPYRFEIRIPAGKGKTHYLEVRAFDKVGNRAVKRLTVVTGK